MNPIKILITDDHDVIIKGIATMLEGTPEMQVIGSANDGTQALAFLGAHPDTNLVLMDIRMPNKNGIETTREVTRSFPGVRVLALTTYDDEEYITNMLQAGATGYILKNTGKNELQDAIRKVSQGESYFSREVTRAVMSKYMSRKDAESPASTAPPAAASGSGSARSVVSPAVELTNREIEILKLIACEMTNQAIADKLFISPRTVHSHRRNLMQKIGVKNTAGLVRYAIQQGLIDK